MQHVIGFQISLRPEIAAEEFETAFQRIIEETRESRGAVELDQVEHRLYRSTPGRPEFLWVTRLPDSEFERVSRAAWPFVILEIRGILTSIRERFAAEVTAFSGAVQTLQELEGDWNARFGRFTKLSLDAPGPSTGV